MTPPDSACGWLGLLALAAALLFALPGKAEAPFEPVTGDPLAESWRWRVYPELNGLGAECMMEASDGTLWFGVPGGVWTYDGFQWRQHADAHLPGIVLSLCSPKAGVVLAGGHWGIAEYANGAWTRVLPGTGNWSIEVRKLAVARDGTVWAASAFGALRRDAAGWTLFTTPKIAESLPPSVPKKIVRLELLPESVSRNAGGPEGDPRRHDLTAIRADREGRVWFGTVEGELLCFSPPTPAAPGGWSLHNETDGLRRGRWPTILELQDGRIWVTYLSGSGSINLYDGRSWQTIPLAGSGGPEDCASQVQTRDGTVWATGLYIIAGYKNGRWKVYRKPEAPIPSARNFIVETADGALWVAGPSTEILRVDYETARWLTLKHLLFGCETADGVQWFLHRDGRVVRHDHGHWTSFGPEDGVIDTPVALLATRGGEVWAAGSHGPDAATARFDGARWSRTVHDEFSWRIDPQGVWEGFDGSVWFAAAVDSSGPARHRAGILQYRSGTWIHHHQPGRAFTGGDDRDPSSLLPATQRPEPIGKFLKIAGSGDGRVWAARNIVVFNDGSRWSIHAPTPPVRLGVVETLFTSRERELWVGTRQYGAVQYDGRRWIRHQGRDSLVANSVFGFAQTSDGSLWAATDRGVSRYDGSTWSADVLPREIGLTGVNGTILAGGPGSLWINRFTPEWMTRGWSKRPALDPEKVVFETCAHRFAGPPPETEIVVGQTHVAHPGSLSILWQGAAPWRDPAVARLQYSYRLDDSPWSAFDNDRGAAFLSLASGPHRFEVRTRDRDFNIDPTPAVLEFVVRPPVWRQTWFIVLVLVLGGAAVGLALRVLLERARLRRANRELAGEVAVRKETEAALRASEAGLMEAQALARFGSWRFDPRPGMFEVSEEIARILELERTQASLSLRDLLERIHPADRDSLEHAFREALASGKEFSAEHRAVLPGGRVRHIHGRGRVVQAGGAGNIHLVGTLQDVTERKEAENRIRQLNRTYAVLSDINQLIVREREPRELFRQACAIAVEKGGFGLAWIGVWDPAGHRLRLAAASGGTPEILAMLDASLPGSGPGGPDRPVVAAGDQACLVRNQLVTELAAGTWRDALVAHGLGSMVSLPLRADGKLLGAVNFYAFEPGFFDPGELRLLEELSHDIAFGMEGCRREEERRRALEQLRASEERFRELAERIEDVFWIADCRRDELLYVSPAFRKIWGLEPDAVRPAGAWPASVHPEDQARVGRATRPSGRLAAYDEEYRITRPDGSIRWIRDRAFAVRNSQGEIERMVGVARDITVRRELEDQFRQAQKMEAVGQLAGGVAHDFNNILAAIMLQAEMAGLAAALPPEVAESLSEIRTAATRAANLTRQLLLFSRREVLQTQEIDLNEIVSNVAKMLRRLIGEHIRLELHTAAEPLFTVADPGMMDQVLLNLAVNARDAMPAGGRLVIETEARNIAPPAAGSPAGAAPGAYVMLAVTDTGCGIAPEILPRIFEPFFTTKAPGKGTGLGLATVFGIARQHRGWVTVESAVGHGSCFRLFLPACSGPPAASADGDRERLRLNGTETILLVEDDDSLRRTTRTLLERYGYRVIEAESGARAQLVWPKHRDEIALLVTDVIMPDKINGHELAARLRADRPGLHVVFTTGYSPEQVGGQFEPGPADRFLQKPYPPEQLLGIIRSCLDAAG